MPVLYHELSFKSTAPIEIIDITSIVKKSLIDKNCEDFDLLHLASLHTTCALMINEHCEALQKDMLDFLKQIAPPQDSNYRHDKIAVDGRPNTHSHLLGMFFNSHLSLVIKNKKIQLGDWQSIFLVELDGPREERKVQLSFFQY